MIAKHLQPSLGQRTSSVLVLCILFFLPLPLYAQPLTPDQQDFLQGFEYLKSGDRVRLAEVKTRLQNHPLYPQLVYQDTLRNFDKVPDSVTLSFIERYQHLAIAGRLEQHWLTYLGDQQQWQRLLQYQTPNPSLRLQCHYLRAQIEQQPEQLNLTDLQNFWLAQSSFQGACKSIEDYLFEQQHLPGWLIWQKIDQAMAANNTRLAQSLMPHLSSSDQQALRYWIGYHQNPQKLITQLPTESTPFLNRKIFMHSLERLANRQPEAAEQLLQLHQQRYNIHPTEKQKIERIISLRFAYRYAPEAQRALQTFNLQAADSDTLRWQAQIALRDSDWSNLLNTIQQMDLSDRNSPKWLYWQARALEKHQEDQVAQRIYQSLAQQRNYYGFLSADRLRQSYQLLSSQMPSQKSPQQIHQKYPALALIENLLAVEWHINAQREWQHLIQHADTQDLTMIAQIASEWQQHNFAIRALAQGQQWDALELRFPTPYKEPVMQNAERNNIDASWIYSIMRRESAYQSHARSSAGAVGLMQLMPNTAQYVGRQLGFSRQQYRNLTDAQSNIELGSAYLGYLMQKYEGHLVKATAAYNAGPRRVDQWLPQQQIAADQWIDSIPFRETRKYVKSVLEYKVVFETLLDQTPQRLESLMLPIGNSPSP